MATPQIIEQLNLRDDRAIDTHELTTKRRSHENLNRPCFHFSALLSFCAVTVAYSDQHNTSNSAANNSADCEFSFDSDYLSRSGMSEHRTQRCSTDFLKPL